MTGRETIFAGFSSFVLADASVAILCNSEFFEIEPVTEVAALGVEVSVLCNGRVFCTELFTVVDKEVFGVVDGSDVIVDEGVEESGVSPLLSDCLSEGSLGLSDVVVDDVTAVFTVDIVGLLIVLPDAEGFVLEDTLGSGVSLCDALLDPSKLLTEPLVEVTLVILVLVSAVESDILSLALVVVCVFDKVVVKAVVKIGMVADDTAGEVELVTCVLEVIMESADVVQADETEDDVDESASDFVFGLSTIIFGMSCTLL